jgi:folylpolyglutamate synthase/dihydropteroate synthase
LIYSILPACEKQLIKVTIAFAALKIAHQEVFNLTEYNIRKGFENVVSPGRFEVLRKEPPVLVDSAIIVIHPSGYVRH